MDTTGAIGGEIDTITGGIKLNSFFLADGTEECLAGGVQFFPGFFVRISSHPEAAGSYTSLGAGGIALGGELDISRKAGGSTDNFGITRENGN
jgi:hypothetical protein